MRGPHPSPVVTLCSHSLRRVNCPFYFKIGACRHGDMCSRLHNKPTISETVLLKNMYQNPLASAVSVDGSALEMDDKELQHHFEEFYEDVFTELSNFGKLEMLHVCDNLGDHLLGNVYAKFKSEEDADKAVKGLTGRFYAGRPIMVEFSPVTDFKEARCRQFDVSDCTRGGYCNFMHLKQIGPELSRKLFGTSRPAEHAQRRRSPERSDRDRGGRSGGGRDYGGRDYGGRDRRDDRYDSRDRRDDRDRDYRRDDRGHGSRDYGRDDRDRYSSDRRRDDRGDRGGDSRGSAPGGPPPGQYPPYNPNGGAPGGAPPAPGPGGVTSPGQPGASAYPPTGPGAAAPYPPAGGPPYGGAAPYGGPPPSQPPGGYGAPPPYGYAGAPPPQDAYGAGGAPYSQPPPQGGAYPPPQQQQYGAPPAGGPPQV